MYIVRDGAGVYRLKTCRQRTRQEASWDQNHLWSALDGDGPARARVVEGGDAFGPSSRIREVAAASAIGVGAPGGTLADYPLIPLRWRGFRARRRLLQEPASNFRADLRILRYIPPSKT